MKNRYIVTLLSGLLTVFVVSFMPNIASAANEGDFMMTVKSELGYPVAGTGFSVWCSTGNATTSVAGVTGADGTATLASTSLSLGLPPISCKNADTFHITATTTGYISTTTYSGTYTTAGGGNAMPMWTNYSLKVTSMLSENGVSIVPATSTMPFSSTSPAVGLITVASSTRSGTTWYLAASSTGATGGTLMATTSGYVNNTIVNVITSTSTQRTVHFNSVDATAGGNDFATSSFLFGLRVVVADQFGNPIIPRSATFRGSATTSSSGATLYWADTTNTDGILNILAPGYLDASTTNTAFEYVKPASTTPLVITLGTGSAVASTSPIVATSSSSYSVKGLETMLKITAAKIIDELGNALSPLIAPFSVSGNLDLISQTYNGGYWYVAASSTDMTTGGTLTASVDGYVSKDVSNVLTSTTSQQTADWGSSDTSTYNGVALPYALKVTATDSAGASLSGATVTAGNSYGVSCLESGTTGVYYCVIPLANTGSKLLATKTGYYTNSADYSYRTAASTAQRAATVVLTANVTSSTSGSSSAGSGGGGGYYIAPVTVPAVVTQYVPGCPVGYTCTARAVFTPSAPVSATSPVMASFTRRLTKGISGNDVKNLQAALNSDADTRIASAGAGSPGNETNFFGSLTTQAVQKFQVKYGIAKPGDDGYGQVGPMTRAKLNALFGGR